MIHDLKRTIEPAFAEIGLFSTLELTARQPPSASQANNRVAQEGVR